jgi:ribosomal protein S12 methylthiotransferase
MTRRRSKPTYALVSLGCPKNLVDSERMAGLLRREGYRMVREAEGADFVVVNTCGFIGDARSESHAVIQEMVELKRRGRLGGVIVAGCMVERDKDRLLATYPDIDQIIGVFARDEIATAAHRLLDGTRMPCPPNSATAAALRHREEPLPILTVEQRSLFRPAPSKPLADTQRLRITPRHLAFLKIAEGCNRLCSFCAIPRMRGPYASKSVDEVVAEAQELAADGARELVLVAQDTTFYGVDLDGRPRLAELLAKLDQVEGLAWIRVMYLYPMHVTDGLLDVLASAKKILPYLDLPLQHINDDVLRRMRRRVSREETERLLDRLRERIGRLVLRTTLIAGFPGETERQFEELVEFVQRRRFERLGAFAYSEEPGTYAAELDGALPEEVKQARRERLLAVQQPIAFAWNESLVGRTLDVIIDGDIPGQRNAYLGRSYADAPEVDGAVYVTGKKLTTGQIVHCEIVAAQGYDLVGVGTGEEMSGDCPNSR